MDTPRKDLLLWLVNPPKYGHIENTKRGEACLCDLYYLTNGEHMYIYFLYIHVAADICHTWITWAN